MVVVFADSLELEAYRVHFVSASLPIFPPVSCFLANMAICTILHVFYVQFLITVSTHQATVSVQNFHS